MSSLEERDMGVAAAPGSSSAGLGVGAVGAAMEAVAGVAAMQDEVGMRREGPESDADEPPKKRVKIPEGESGKLEERLYSVLCCTVCLDLPKASVYQVNMVSITNLPRITVNLPSNKSTGPHTRNPLHVSQQPTLTINLLNVIQFHLFLAVQHAIVAPAVHHTPFNLSHESPDTPSTSGQLCLPKFIL